MYRVFVSHASRDQEWMAWIKGHVGPGIELYLAEHDPRPGVDLSEKIRAEIDASDAVLVFVTDASQASAYVNQEIGYALHAKKPLVPLVQLGIPAEQLGMLGDVERIHFDFTRPEAGRDLLLLHLATSAATKAANDNLKNVLLLIGAVAVIGLLVTNAGEG